MMRSLTMIVTLTGLVMGASPCSRWVRGGGHHGGGNAGNGGGGEACGPVNCDRGQECCNESCGICVDPGGVCTQQECIPERCGPTTCSVGQECCNESCGICVDPGGACTEQFCEPGPFCGGIAGIDCPGAGMCADDWRDDCDPNNGGADCGGVCTCSGAAVLCIVGTVFDDNPEVCACVATEKVACGGFPGTPCPGAGMCVDDPSDDCDPENGGADCGGLCDCSGISALCIDGTVFDNSPGVCACVAQ